MNASAIVGAKFECVSVNAGADVAAMDMVFYGTAVEVKNES